MSSLYFLRVVFFFFNDTATTEIYTLSLHDALPIWRLLKSQGCPPRRMISDKLGSYAAARRQIMPAVEHRSNKGLNNRAENSHVPLRKRERPMQGFRSPGGLQRFVTVFSVVRNLFVPPHSRRSALATHLHRLDAM